MAIRGHGRSTARLPEWPHCLVMVSTPTCNATSVTYCDLSIAISDGTGRLRNAEARKSHYIIVLPGFELGEASDRVA